jgi:4-carboxymuconolactone decarboxylase
MTDSHDPATQVLGPDTDRARFERGFATFASVDGEGGQRVIDSLSDIAPALAQHIVAYGFGDVYSRPGLTPPQRQLVTIGMLTALGGCEPQLDVHLNTALNVGLTPTEIVEAITHAAVYCGFPKALNAITVARKVFGERDLLPVQDAGEG